ncbi:MAG: hypothetical protein HQ564_06115 [Candidatus Saganbacteria bacterium]|nr:hypothetical protein [Candidatus Saganbacteria bacterium]
MSISIEKAQYFKRELRRADAATKSPKQGNGHIDTAQEADKALTSILTNLEIEKAPAVYQKMLRKDVDHKSTGDQQANDKIDPKEVAAARKLLLKGKTRYEVLSNFAYFTPKLPTRTLSCKSSGPVFPIPQVSVSRKRGKYYKPLTKLANFFLKNSGDPPNASNRSIVGREKAIGAYHIYENKATHLKNGGATTSETQALFFNFMVLYAALTGKKEGMRGAYNYVKYYMMPHDMEKASPQLPDHTLVFSNKRDNPYFMHWLVALSEKNLAGSVCFGRDVLYKIYDPDKIDRPCIVQIKNTLDPEKKVKTLPNIHSKHKGTSDTMKFSSALDAEQWMQEGLLWAKMFKLADYTPDIKCFRESLKYALTPSRHKYPGITQYAYWWGGSPIDKIGWHGGSQDVYSGYQNPAAWLIMGKKDTAKRIVYFLGQAQKEFQKRHKISGPFIPVFRKGKFGWTGIDPNTHWTGFQFRVFAKLAHYYYLSGDKKAKTILDNFYKWTKSNMKLQGTKISVPLEIHNKGSNTGKTRRMGYDPHHHGLIAQGLIYMAARDKNAQYKKDAQMFLDDLSKNRQAKNGSFKYSDDPEAKNRGIYGFHNAEVGIAFGLYELLLNQ